MRRREREKTFDIFVSEREIFFRKINSRQFSVLLMRYIQRYIMNRELKLSYLNIDCELLLVKDGKKKKKSIIDAFHVESKYSYDIFRTKKRKVVYGERSYQWKRPRTSNN